MPSEKVLGVIIYRNILELYITQTLHGTAISADQARGGFGGQGPSVRWVRGAIPVPVVVSGVRVDSFALLLPGAPRASRGSCNATRLRPRRRARGGSAQVAAASGALGRAQAVAHQLSEVILAELGFWAALGRESGRSELSGESPATFVAPGIARFWPGHYWVEAIASVGGHRYQEQEATRKERVPGPSCLDYPGCTALALRDLQIPDCPDLGWSRSFGREKPRGLCGWMWSAQRLMDPQTTTCLRSKNLAN